MANIHDAVKAYLDRGWHPIPVKEFGKSPSSSGWQTTKPDAQNFMSTQNVGILLGEASGGLIDIDLDIPQARLLARETDLFAGLPAFGREGDLPGHRLVVCPGAPAEIVQFGLPSGNGLGLPKDMVLEVRAKGQTVFPPSRYLREDNSVQSLVWTTGSMPEAIPEISWEELRWRAGILALLSVVLATYPAQGNRDNVCMALAGTLVRLGVEADLADDLIVTVARLAGDEEHEKRRGKARAAANKIAAGEEVTGLPKLLELLGLTELGTSIRKWLGVGSDPLVIDPGAPYDTAERFRSSEAQTLTWYQATWLEYKGAAYAIVPDDEIRAKLYRFLDKCKSTDKDGNLHPFRPNTGKVNQVVDSLKARTHFGDGNLQPPLWLDSTSIPAKEILSFPNGLLHLPTRTLMPCSDKFFTLNAVEFVYQSDAPTPNAWLRFLSSIWEDDPESIDLLQEIFGYLLLPDTSQQKMFIIKGPTRSGKGTIGRILSELIGRRNVTFPTLNSLGSDFGLEPLVGKQLAVISDMSFGKKTNTATLRENLMRITGEDNVSVNRKHKPVTDWRLSVRFLISTNTLPRLHDSSGAFANRFIPLVMNRSFLGKEDHGLEGQLLAELPGIMNWAIEGWLRLKHRGHFQLPESSKAMLDELRTVGAPITRFVEETCILESRRRGYQSGTLREVEGLVQQERRDPEQSHRLLHAAPRGVWGLGAARQEANLSP